VRAAEQLARGGVAALEDPPERLGRRFARLAKADGTSAVPPARTLAVAGQVLLAVLGDLAGVVALRPAESFATSTTTPRLPPAPLSASERTPDALLSSEKMMRT
jgi:hypothetical protein